MKHLASFIYLTHVVVAQNVVQFDFVSVRKPRPDALARRAQPLSASLTNDGLIQYLATVYVGTPPQALQLSIGTDSSDIWLPSYSASYCASSPAQCGDGTFSSSKSSTYKNLNSVFNITYVDESHAIGSYFTDSMAIGTSTAVVNNVQMGLGTDITFAPGILGLGFASNQAASTQYPTLVDQMYSQGKINSRAFSVWLNDLQANTGSLVFGGVDTAKYREPLLAVAMLQDSSGSYTQFTVALTAFTLTKIGAAPMTGFTNSSFSEPVYLGTGTTLHLCLLLCSLKSRNKLPLNTTTRLDLT